MMLSSVLLCAINLQCHFTVGNHNMD